MIGAALGSLAVGLINAAQHYWATGRLLGRHPIDLQSGVPLLAQSETDTQRFFTGLKPDNPGYADLEVAGSRYTVRVDQGQSEVALDLTMPSENAKCSQLSTEDAATAIRGWVVRFRRVSPAP